MKGALFFGILFCFLFFQPGAAFLAARISFVWLLWLVGFDGFLLDLVACWLLWLVWLVWLLWLLWLLVASWIS